MFEGARKLLFGIMIGFDLTSLDVFSKWYVLHLSPSAQIIPGIFAIGLYQNPGIAFSLPVPMMVVVPVTVVLLAFCLSQALQRLRPDLFRVGAILTCMGGASNLIDRTLTGYTTDYLIFFSRSAINIADILIVTGLVLMAWYYREDHAGGNAM